MHIGLRQETAACYLLPPILTRMQQVLPDIQTELVVSNLLRRCDTPGQPADLLKHALIGHVLDQSIVQGFVAMGHPIGPEHFALRTDDLNAYWELVRAGAGVGFVANFVARSDSAMVAILPALKVAPIPVWLAVHREIRTRARIRAVFAYLADAVPSSL